MSKILFEVVSKLGVSIRTTESHWKLITEIKHPEIKGLESEVKLTLLDPSEIRISQDDENVYLYYSVYEKYFLCVVARHLNHEGFIITCYLTSKIKEGERAWKK